MDNPTDKLLTYQEAAEILRISQNTLRQWTSRGKVPYTKLGGRALFTTDQINEIIKAGSRRGGRQP